MAEKKSGPIKPPIIDLEANKTKSKDPKKPTAKTSKTAKKEAKSTLTKEKLPKKTSTNFQPTPIILGSLGGAILGVGAAFLIAQMGLWPQNTKQITPINQMAEKNFLSISELNKKITDFENINLELNKRIDELQSQNDNMIKQFDEVDEKFAKEIKENISLLNEEITKVKTSLEQASSSQTNQSDSNLSEINKQLANLDERLNALSLGASNEEAKDFSSLIAPLKQNLLKLNEQINNINKNNDFQNAQINTLEKNFDALTQKISEIEKIKPLSPTISQSNDNQSSLIILKLNDAIDSGKSFAPILNELKSISPEIEISKTISKLAIDGLKNPQTIIDEFSANVPAILLAKPKIKGANWQQTLADKAKSLIALRPTKEIEGNNPSAMVAQIENALEKRDFIKANELINSLPPQMQKAIGNVSKDIANFAIVQKFIQNLKNNSLNEGANK